MVVRVMPRKGTHLYTAQREDPISQSEMEGTGSQPIAGPGTLQGASIPEALGPCRGGAVPYRWQL